MQCSDRSRFLRVNGYSDPTGNEASFRANLESAIRKCDFSGDILEGIDNSEKIIEEAYILKDMMEIQHLYELQVDCLVSEEPDSRIVKMLITLSSKDLMQPRRKPVLTVIPKRFARVMIHLLIVL